MRDDSQRPATVVHPHRITLRAQLAAGIAHGQPALPLVFAGCVVRELPY